MDVDEAIGRLGERARLRRAMGHDDYARDVEDVLAYVERLRRERGGGGLVVR